MCSDGQQSADGFFPSLSNLTSVSTDACRLVRIAFGGWPSPPDLCEHGQHLKRRLTCLCVSVYFFFLVHSGKLPAV